MKTAIRRWRRVLIWRARMKYRLTRWYWGEAERMGWRLHRLGVRLMEHARVRNVPYIPNSDRWDSIAEDDRYSPV